jgi:hypothetical protein
MLRDPWRLAVGMLATVPVAPPTVVDLSALDQNRVS